MSLILSWSESTVEERTEGMELARGAHFRNMFPTTSPLEDDRTSVTSSMIRWHPVFLLIGYMLFKSPSPYMRTPTTVSFSTILHLLDLAGPERVLHAFFQGLSGGKNSNLYLSHRGLLSHQTNKDSPSQTLTLPLNLSAKTARRVTKAHLVPRKPPPPESHLPDLPHQPPKVKTVVPDPFRRQISPYRVNVMPQPYHGRRDISPPSTIYITADKDAFQELLLGLQDIIPSNKSRNPDSWLDDLADKFPTPPRKSSTPSIIPWRKSSSSSLSGDSSTSDNDRGSGAFERLKRQLRGMLGPVKSEPAQNESKVMLDLKAAVDEFLVEETDIPEAILKDKEVHLRPVFKGNRVLFEVAPEEVLPTTITRSSSPSSPPLFQRPLPASHFPRKSSLRFQSRFVEEPFSPSSSTSSFTDSIIDVSFDSDSSHTTITRPSTPEPVDISPQKPTMLEIPLTTEKYSTSPAPSSILSPLPPTAATAKVRARGFVQFPLFPLRWR